MYDRVTRFDSLRPKQGVSVFESEGGAPMLNASWVSR
jgi:hypothetical protein